MFWIRVLLITILQVLPAMAAEALPAPPAGTGTIASDKMDQWHGFNRRKFVCDGCEAWIAEPKNARPGRPWSWCLEFPDAFTDRCAAPALLASGFHHGHIAVGNTFGSPGP